MKEARIIPIQEQFETHKPVYKTQDYHLFQFIDANREPVTSHVTALARSIARNNLLADAPILVDHNMKILDGQHRFLAAKKSKEIIYFIFADSTAPEDIGTMNSDQKNWSTLDFAHFWATRNNEHYIKFLRFNDNYKLPASVSIPLLAGVSMTSGGFSIAKTGFKEGNFEIADYEAAIGIASQLSDFEPWGEYGVVRSRNFVAAAVKMFVTRGYDHEKMLHKLEIAGRKIELKARVLDYLRALEDIYNFNQKKDTIRLF